MDKELFELATAAALRIPSSGIGTLSEKKVHAALKYYVQPDKDKHEIKNHGFVSDALSDDGVFEIQTRGFYRLTKKLSVLLTHGTVTVVYPIVAKKLLYLTDAENGEVTVRRSSKRMTPHHVFAELYGIRDFLTSENLRLRLITIEAEEHRVIKVKTSKKGRKKVETLSGETVPTNLIDDVTLSSASDYKAFLPSTLPKLFTSAEYAAAFKISRSLSGTTLLILTELKLVTRIGKIGNAYVYKITGVS